MRERKSGLFAATTIVIVLALALFLVFSDRILKRLSTRYISSEPSLVSFPGTSASSSDYFNAAILENKEFQALKDYSGGFDFNTIGQKTMAPAQNIVDKEGNVIGQKVPSKTYLGNTRPF